MIRGLMDKAGGRKFALTVLIVLVGVGALFAGRLTGSEWTALCLGLVTAYGAANAASKKYNGPTGKPETLPAPIQEEMLDVGH